jgi:glycosyltransferase involved in cell wall biosynthesis
MVDISVVTFTLGGRNEYLFRCLDSVYQKEIEEQYIYGVDCTSLKIEHHLIFQGAMPAPEIKQALSVYRESDYYKLIIHYWPENIGIGAGLNKILPECKGDLIFKMDDDAKIISSDFFDKAYALYKRFPNSVFSPLPCGLLRSPGGPPALNHKVWWDKTNDIIWTKRIVNHVGGFARFAPKTIMEKFKFSNDLIPGISGTEDGQLSSYCNSNNIEMFYLEDGLIVSHQETCYGQLLRNPEYFAGRSWESTIKLNIEE